MVKLLGSEKAIKLIEIKLCGSFFINSDAKLHHFFNLAIGIRNIFEKIFFLVELLWFSKRIL